MRERPGQGARGDFHKQPARRHIGEFSVINLDSGVMQLQDPVEAVEFGGSGAARHADHP